MSLDGAIFYSHSQVLEEITKLYQPLLGTTTPVLPTVDINVTGGGNVSSRNQQVQLIRPVEKKVI